MRKCPQVSPGCQSDPWHKMVKDPWSDKTQLETRGQGLCGACLWVAVGPAGKSLGGTWVKSLPFYLLVCDPGSITSGLSPISSSIKQQH